MQRKHWFTGILAAAGSVSVLALGAEATKDIFNGNTEQRLDAIAAIQPGLGTVMIEYGNRFTDAYFAARGGNWGLAQYQLNEMIEIQEVGEITRPRHADALKGFEDGYLAPLKEAVENKDFTGFDEAFRDAVAGCNDCHVGTEHAYVKYVLPQVPVEAYLDFNMKSEPAYSEDED